MEEARRRAIRVPEDLSVIGFDDSFMASRTTPPLTTVAQPLVEMGQLAVRSLTAAGSRQPGRHPSHRTGHPSGRPRLDGATAVTR